MAKGLGVREAGRTGTLLPATPRRRTKPVVPAGAPRLEQIRCVGCHLLFQYGYAGMTMRQIAASLHIKAASLYYHFPSKQEILFDLMYGTASALMEGLLRIVDPDGPMANDPRAQLDAAIRWHVLFHTQKKEEAFVSHSELRSLTAENLKAILRVRRGYDTLFAHILARCQAAGVIPKRDTSVARNAILTMCTATAGWFSPHGPLSAEQVAEEIRDFVWRGLLRCPEAAAARSSGPREGLEELPNWHREALREPPVPAPEVKPDPILELLRKLKNAKIKQLQRQKPHQSA